MKKKYIKPSVRKKTIKMALFFQGSNFFNPINDQLLACSCGSQPVCCAGFTCFSSGCG